MLIDILVVSGLFVVALFFMMLTLELTGYTIYFIEKKHSNLLMYYIPIVLFLLVIIDLVGVLYYVHTNNLYGISSICTIVLSVLFTFYVLSEKHQFPFVRKIGNSLEEYLREK